MDRIELKVDPAVEAAEAVDELCSRVPELRAQWEAALEAASAEELEALELPWPGAERQALEEFSGHRHALQGGLRLSQGALSTRAGSCSAA